MPSTPYAKLLAAVNGGTPTGGAITSTTYGDTIQLSAESTAQWNLTTPPRWEIYSYPAGWTGPASGWTTESVAQPFGGTADVYVYTGLGPPPAFDLPASPLWGKWLFKLTVQGGLLNGIPTNTLIDDTLAIEIVGPGGIHDTATLEGIQFSSSRAWSGDVQENWRIIATAIVGAASPYSATPAVVASGTGSAGASALYARGDHSHQLTFATLNTILGTANGAISINGQTLTGGGFIGPYFSTNATPVASTGLLRGAHNSVLVASRSSTNSDDVPIVSYGTDVADHVTFGDALIPCMRFVIASGCDFDFYGDADLLYTLAQGSISVGATNQFLITHTVGTGSGASAVIRAQAGATGVGPFDGGTLQLESGNAGTGGIDGNVDINAKLGVVTIRGNNVSIFSTTPDAGGGAGVVYIDDATTEPDKPINGGAGIWAYGDALKSRNDAVAVLIPAVEGSAAEEDLRNPDKRSARLLTPGSTTTTALSFTMPDDCTALFTMVANAWTPDGGASAGFERKVVYKRYAGSAATIVGAINNVHTAADDPSLAATIDTDGANTVRARVTGLAATNFEWFVTFTVQLMQPA